MPSITFVALTISPISCVAMVDRLCLNETREWDGVKRAWRLSLLHCHVASRWSTLYERQVCCSMDKDVEKIFSTLGNMRKQGAILRSGHHWWQFVLENQEREREKMLLRLKRIYTLYVSLHYRSTVTNDQLSKYNHYFSLVLPFFSYFLSLFEFFFLLLMVLSRSLSKGNFNKTSIWTMNSLLSALALLRAPLQT